MVSEVNNIKTYTTGEIEKDIFELEHIRIKFGNDYFLFSKLYSDYYNHESLPNDETVDDLKIRIKQYMHDSVIGLLS